MSQYLVSARKYRPDSFSDVVGQKHITQSLESAIQTNQIAHAYLFCGPRGIGKTSCARIFAGLVNTGSNSNSIYNIFELDGASNNKVEDIRNLIEQVKIPPQTGRYKVYIIDEVHMLSTAAFNAFLKTLEEPPKHSIFVLATTEKQKIIPTILSRCQIFDFKPITVHDIAEHLKKIANKEGIDTDDKSTRIIAEKADGSLRDALSIFDRIRIKCNEKWNHQEISKILLAVDSNFAIEITNYFAKNNIPASLLAVNKLLNDGFSPQNIIETLINHFRNLVMAKDVKTSKLILEEVELIEEITKQAEQLSHIQIIDGLNCLHESTKNLKHSINQQFLLELCIMQLCSLKENTSSKKKIPINPPETENTLNITSDINPHLKHKKEPIHRKNEEYESKEITELEKHTTTSKISTKLKKGLSSNLFQINKSNQVKKSQNSNLENIQLTTPLNKAIIKEKWITFAKLLKSQSKINLCNIFERYFPDIQENKLILTIVSMSEQAEIIEIKPQLLSFLKTETSNNQITLELVLSKEETEENMLYTNKEKWQHLLTKNKNIEILKDKLDLNII